MLDVIVCCFSDGLVLSSTELLRGNRACTGRLGPRIPEMAISTLDESVIIVCAC